MLSELLEKRLGVRVVGAEEGGVFAVLRNPGRGLFEDELLRARYAYVARWVGSGLKHELDSEVFAGRFHYRAAASERLVAHVAREGDVDEGLAPELLRGVDNEVTARYEVGVYRHVGDGGDDVRIFVGFTCEAKDVVSLLLNAAESFRRSGNSLVDDDDLHLRVVGESRYLRDCRLHLGHEVVGVGEVLDHSAVSDVAVLLNHELGAAEVVLALRHGSGYDPDVERGLGHSGGAEAERRQNDRQQ